VQEHTIREKPERPFLWDWGIPAH